MNIVNGRQRRRRTPEHEYITSISSACETEGSGELKTYRVTTVSGNWDVMHHANISMQFRPPNLHLSSNTGFDRGRHYFSYSAFRSVIAALWVSCLKTMFLIVKQTHDTI